MPIDLKKALSEKLPPYQSGRLFKFEQPGDQLIFRFIARRQVQFDGRENDAIDCNALAGQKVVGKKATPVKTGLYTFFLNTTSRQIFDNENPQRGELMQLQLLEMRKDKRNLKIFG